MEDAGDRPEGLRPAMMTWKSCENLRAGHCKWGDSCYYAHTQEESEVFAQWQKAKRAAQKGKEPLPPPDRYFRTQICSKWREGTCRNGAACTFAHGEEALRRPPPLPPSTSAAGRWEPRRPPSSPRCEPEAEAEGQQQAAQRPRPPHLCKFWAERGNCRFGDDCRYEHTPSERGSRMQEDYVPPHRRPDAADGEQQGFWRAGSGGPGFAGYAPEGKLFKTKLCANFSESGQCRYGDRCNFAHGEQELQPMPQFYRGGGGWGGEEGEAGGEADFFDSWKGDSRRAPPGYGPRAAYQQPPPPPAAPGTAAGSGSAHAAADGSRPRGSYNPLAAQRAQAPTSLTDNDFPPLPATSAAAPSSAPATGSSAAARKDPPAMLRVRTSGGAASLSSGGPSTPSPTSPAVPGGGAISSSSPSHACSSASEAAPPSVSGEPSQNALSSSAGSGSVDMDAVEPELAAAAAAAEAQGSATYYRSGSSLDGSGYHGGVSSGGVSSGGESVMSASEYGDGEEEQEQQQQQQQAGEAQQGAGSLAAEAVGAMAARQQEQQQLAPQAAAPAPPLPPPVEVTFNPCGNPPASAAGSTAAALSRRSTTTSDLPTTQAMAAPPAAPAPAAAAPAVAPAPAPTAPPAKPALIVPGIGGLFSYRCPLTKAPFVDPVLAADGFTYERKAIHDWLFIKGKEVSPVTGDPMPTVLLVPNKVVRGMMAEMDNVLRCIANGVQPPLAPAPTGLAGI